MRGILRLAIIAALLYVGYTQGRPWLERHQKSKADTEAGSADASASAACVSRARAANDALASELLPLAAPGSDRGSWGTALVRTGGALTDADDACRCGTDACLQASLAISEMRKMVESLNNAVRGSAPPPTNPAHLQERIDRLLDEAQRLARG